MGHGHLRIVSLLCALCLLLPLALFTACGNTDGGGEQKDGQGSEISGLPQLHLTTQGGADILSKEDYITCTADISNVPPEYEANGWTGQIRCRGNTSYTVDKKSFRVKFDRRQQPLGLGNGPCKSWALLAEQVDKSMMRDYLMYRLSSYVLGDGYFSPDCAYVELTVNGEYRGLYLMAEQIESDVYRIDTGEETGLPPVFRGFLVELEQSEFRREGQENVDYFRIAERSFGETDYYTVKGKDISADRTERICDYLRNVYAATARKDSEALAEYIDIDSAARMFVIQMLACDKDSNYSSTFLYKTVDGKLTFGPPWDFDLALGNYRDNESPELIFMPQLLLSVGSFGEVQSAARALWKQLRDEGYFDTLLAETDAVRAQIAPAAERNAERWNVWGELYSTSLTEDAALFTCHEEAYRHLTDWIKARILFLDTYFGWQSAD